MARLSLEFYMGDTVETARALLGKYLVRRLPDGSVLAGRLTETEAYVGRCDKACHAYNYRRTSRTETLFGPPGRAYIYLIYGMYHCMNVVTEPEGEPAAVLLRAMEPAAGEAIIRRLRFGDKPMTPYRKRQFLNGPGKLCAGLSLTRQENGLALTGDDLYLCDDPADFGAPPQSTPRERICSGPRIGIDYAQEAREFPWRFWLEREE